MYFAQNCYLLDAVYVEMLFT